MTWSHFPNCQCSYLAYGRQTSKSLTLSQTLRRLVSTLSPTQTVNSDIAKVNKGCSLSVTATLQHSCKILPFGTSVFSQLITTSSKAELYLPLQLTHNVPFCALQFLTPARECSIKDTQQDPAFRGQFILTFTMCISYYNKRCIRL